MMIKTTDLNFTYAGRAEPTLNGINFEVNIGEFVLLTGTTGCGKTTLLKCLNGIIPHESSGRMDGTVFVNGLDTQKCKMSNLTQCVGLVFQNPDDQIFNTVVEDEIAFGLENLGLPQKEIEIRITNALKHVGLSHKRESATNELSGGQKQRLAIASILAMNPEVLALDEPISQLDPHGAR
ncbi:MAG: energy-coupling factor ABC transporter ATP-binding protein, partial [bacterium]